MNEDFPQPIEQAETDRLAAEHAQLVCEEVATLGRATEDVYRAPTSRDADAYVHALTDHANSDKARSLPGAREAAQGVAMGSAKNKGYVKEIFAKEVRPTFTASSEDDEFVIKKVETVVNDQDRAVFNYSAQPGSEPQHRGGFARQIESAIEIIQAKEGADKNLVARATALIRGMQLGVATPDQRSKYGEALQKTLIEL